jgi:hypothetical protein
MRSEKSILGSLVKFFLDKKIKQQSAKKMDFFICESSIKQDPGLGNQNENYLNKIGPTLEGWPNTGYGDVKSPSGTMPF